MHPLHYIGMNPGQKRIFDLKFFSRSEKISPKLARKWKPIKEIQSNKEPFFVHCRHAIFGSAKLPDFRIRKQAASIKVFTKTIQFNSSTVFFSNPVHIYGPLRYGSQNQVRVFGVNTISKPTKKKKNNHINNKHLNKFEHHITYGIGRQMSRFYCSCLQSCIWNVSSVPWILPSVQHADRGGIERSTAESIDFCHL